VKEPGYYQLELNLCRTWPLGYGIYFGAREIVVQNQQNSFRGLTIIYEMGTFGNLKRLEAYP